MENTPYASVFGSGTLASCPTGSAPFLCSMLPVSSTIPSMNNYGATAADSNDFNGCSAACYVGLMLGYTYGVSDGYSFSTISGNPQFVNNMAANGLTWQAYCEGGCPRGNDHFPFSGANTFTSSSVSTSSLVTAANGANPPNFLWYTPTDNNNMHDVSVSTGDGYLKSFIVGSGSITSPASGSLLASNLFTNPNFRTVLYLWWDECRGSTGSCDSNNDAPNLLYGTTIKKGYVSPDSTGIDEYASLWTIENNWGLTPQAQGDTAAKNNGYQFNDIFTSQTSLPLTASFTYTPTQPLSGQSISFTGASTGGIAPFSFSWSFGDGTTSSSQSPSHTYTTSGSYRVTLSVTDSTGTVASSAQTVIVTSPSTLTAAFTYSPTVPLSGQAVTFAATASGGTAPYSYSWKLGGIAKTGNPVTQSFTNGTYTVTLTVTDSSSKTASSTQSLIIIPPSAGNGSVPALIGWGGIRMDESQAGIGGASSVVFPGEYASDMELVLMEMKAKGYNTVRVDFDPYCTDTVDYNYMSIYSQTNAQRAVAIAKYYGFWIVLDYHGYSDIFLNTNCWLSYWKPIVQNIGPLYSQIIWDPENEPTLVCNNSPSSCPTITSCSDDTTCVAYLGTAYQQWINQARLLGDTHWVVVQNLCSYSCGFSDFSQGYPTVTDPLGTLSQGGKIFISLHSYMDYNTTSTSWTNSTAEAIANQYYQAVLSGVSNTGWPALNTEGGTDPLSCDPNICAPDTVLDGSAGYTVVTFHFIQTLVNLYDSNSPQRINWVWWPAGSWTNTPGAGTYGALQCNSNPIGWGCLLNIVPVTPPSLTASFTFTPNTPQTNQQVTFTARATGGTSPYTFTWSFGDGTTSTGSAVTHTYTSGGSFTTVLTVKDNSAPQQTITSQETVTVINPLTVKLSYGPASPLTSQSITFTASAFGGTAPYNYAWDFGDSSSGSGSSVTHSYSSAGSFTVTLTVTDNESPQQTATTNEIVTVTSPPPPLSASFSYSPSSLQTGQQVSFSGSASGGASPYTYSWSFGDGSTTAGSSATHTYSSAGSFTVTLTVKDSGSPQQTVSSQQTVTVTSPPPPLSASFTYSPSSPQSGQLATFTASASGGTGSYSLSWTFGDGSTGTGSSVIHAYSSAGSYAVTLNVSDSGSPQQSASSQQTVTVTSPPPALTASFSYAPSSPETGQQVTFTGSASGGTSPYMFTWLFGDGSSGTGATVAHTYSSAGSFTVSLTALDSGSPQQTTSSNQTIPVTSPPPLLSASFTFSPSSPETGQQVSFTGSAIGGTSTYSFSWNFGDGSTASGSSVTYTYVSVGSFNVTLTVKDSGSLQQTTSSQQTITVTNPPAPLLASFTNSPSSPQTGQQVTFSASASGGTSPYTFNWAFGDGSSGSGSSVDHAYSSSGSYTVSLTVQDSGSLQQTATSTATIVVSLPLMQPTSTTITCPGMGIVDENLTCSATVVDTGSGSLITPTGSVSFTQSISCTLSNGSCSVNITATVSGSLTETASYSGDTTHTASTTAPFTIWINKRQTSTTVTCDPTTLTVNQTTNCTVTVKDTSPGTTSTPAGNVTFTPSENCLLTGTGAMANCSTNIAALTVGPLTVSATYLGDSIHNASSGNANVSVTQLPTPPLTADFAFSPPNPLVNQTVIFAATATGGVAPYSYSWSFGDASAASDNPASHAYNTNTTYTVLLAVTDANGTTISIEKTLTVLGLPPPVIVLTLPSSDSVNEGSSLTLNITAVEDTARPISLTCDICSTLGANFTSNSSPGMALAIISWTPSEAQAPGVYSLLIVATDGTKVVNRTVTITVIQVNAPPVLTVPGTLTVRDGEILAFTVNATDPDASLDNITLVATGLPDGSSFDPATGIFYWPIQGVQPGVYTLTFTATDNETPVSQDTATVVVHVDNGNGRCFVCNMFLESQLTLNTSPSAFVMKMLVTLATSLTMVTVRCGVGWWRQTTHKITRHSKDDE